MKKMMIISIVMFLLIGTACSQDTSAQTPSQIDKENNKRIEYAQGDFEYEVIPETFTLKITKDGTTETIAEPQAKRKVSNLQKSATKTSWDFPDDKLHVTIEKQKKITCCLHSFYRSKNIALGVASCKCANLHTSNLRRKTNPSKRCGLEKILHLR